jgi:SWI/SNF related-matrix-associated actin-dependent regulator of chromatin subfamily C
MSVSSTAAATALSLQQQQLLMSSQLASSASSGSNVSHLSSSLIAASTTIQQFDTIRKWLSKHHKKYCENDPPSNKLLSQFLCQFVQFQEEALGRAAAQAAKPHTLPLTRLPFEMLTDFQPGGALCHLFSTIFKFKHEMRISKLDWQFFDVKRLQTFELCAQIEACLIENQRMNYPKIFIKRNMFNAGGPDWQQLCERLEDIARRHKAMLVDNVNEADHIIYPPSVDESVPLVHENNNKQWVRVLKKKSKENVLIHRLFTPDSHDEWLNVEIDDEAAGLNDSDSNSSNGDTWKLTANWLFDTDVYNEWMNEEDYEVDTESINEMNGIVRLKKPPKARKTLEDIVKKQSTRANSRRSPSPAPPNKKLKAISSRKRKIEEISGTSGSNKESKENGELNSSAGDADLTRNMEEPQSQPHVEEVHVPKNVNVKKESSDYQPYRNGTLIDLDEENNMSAALGSGGNVGINHNNEENKDPAILMNGHRGLVNGGASSSSIPFNPNNSLINTGGSATTAIQSSVSANGTSASISEQIEACEQTHHIIVPSYAAWFDYTALHEIEKRALPEFFNQKNKSKTPEIYMGYRNFMIDTYRLNPGEYLSATACRRNLPGDVCAIMRVHAFLEQWGLINYQVDYEARAAPLGPPCTSHFTVLADTPTGLAPITGPRPTTGPAAARQMVDLTGKSKLSKTLSEDGKETGNAASTGTQAFDKLSIENYGLNTKIEKRLTASGSVNGLSAIYGGASAMKAHEWSDQEILLLLEGLEMYRDDWNKVCEHVGTRTQDECILKFLQLPIEDPYLDPSSSMYTSSSTTNSGAQHLGPLAYQPIPFSQSGNPIMSTVAFLASIVDPRVASAAAKAAISEFCKMKDEVPPQTMESHVNSVVQAYKDGKKIDSNYNIEQTGIAIVADSTAKSDATMSSSESSKPSASTSATSTNAEENEASNTKVDKDKDNKDNNESKEVANEKANPTVAPCNEDLKNLENKDPKESKEGEASMEVDQQNQTNDSATNKLEKSEIKEKPTESSKSETTTDPSSDSGTIAKSDSEQTAATGNSSEIAATPVNPTATVTLTTTTTTTTTLSTTTTTTTTASLQANATNGAKSTAKESSHMISELELKNAAASALAAAAVKARQLALNEEKKIKSTVSLLVETQLKKLEIKLRHFEELEAIMDRERENVSFFYLNLFAFIVLLFF